MVEREGKRGKCLAATGRHVHGEDAAGQAGLAACMREDLGPQLVDHRHSRAAEVFGHIALE